MQRTVTWESSWATAFTNLLKDVHENDKKIHDTWFELDEALQQLDDVVIPRLLGVLQSDGHNITPVLVHVIYGRITSVSISLLEESSYSILDVYTRSMSLSSVPGGAVGHSGSTTQSTCASTRSLFNPPNRKKNGMTAIDYITFTHI